MPVIPYKFKNKAFRRSSHIASTEDYERLDAKVADFQTGDITLPPTYGFLYFQPEVFGLKRIGDTVVPNLCPNQNATVSKPTTEDFCNPFWIENASVPLDFGINEFTRNEGGFCAVPFRLYVSCATPLYYLVPQRTS